MYWVSQIFFIFLTVLLMTSFLPILFGWWPIPNLILAVITIQIFKRHDQIAFLWAILGGLLLDLLLTGRGFYTLTFVLLALILDWLCKITVNHPLLGIIYFFCPALILPLIEIVMSGQDFSWRYLIAATANLIGFGLIWLILTSRTSTIRHRI